MNYKRVTLFAGHYGSGKTNLALNYALWLRRQGLKVTVADLDIVNPYFRTKDWEAMLNAAGIDLISSKYANSNLDIPAMPAEVYSLVEDRSIHAVMDIGGDDRGALALGRYAPAILEENDYEMLFVTNRARPLTRTVADTIQVMREIEEACGLPFTGLINNSNLGPDTTVQDVLDSVQYIEDLSRATGLPVKMTCVRKDLAPQLAEQIDAVFPIDLQKLYYMMEE